MPDELRTNKEKKLAAARKKLKAYQQRGGAPQIEVSSLSSNSITEISYNDSNNIAQPLQAESNITAINTSSALAQQDVKQNNNIDLDNIGTLSEAIQILIAEKTLLNNDVSKYRVQCREKELELEEIRTQLNSTQARLDELQQQFVKQQSFTELLRANNAELKQNFAQACAVNDDQNTHIQELQKELSLNKETIDAQAHVLKSTNYKLDIAEIRIKQLSDETNLCNDNREETMIQTQLMHEQQIRDLQAMLQQLTEEKEQANVQYQNYVQQLNVQITKLNKRHVEIQQENESLQQREQQLVNHISGLEREIQKNFNIQQKLKNETETETNENISSSTEEKKLCKKIKDLEMERHEYLLKIKSNEEVLQLLKKQLHHSQCEEESLKERLEALSSEQPEQTKLLAIMESDKVAASRALMQNLEMKKQLDELELRFVQLTNEKADLRNSLDAEEFAAREMRTNYQAMKECLRSKEEFFKLKDEEMIRLAHENTKLTNEVQKLQEMLQEKSVVINGEFAVTHVNDVGNGVNIDNIETCVEAKESSYNPTTMDLTTDTKIYTTEAMGKLQEKFTKLMSQVANLTDEKQRLEHLVLQLQSETETIGEYITLYQTQRRMLKQREYEKAAQMQLLQAEREQLCEKIQMLNNLVSSLVGIPANVMADNYNSALDMPKESLKVTLENSNKGSSFMESQLIINKIQHIITEIEENTKNTVLESDKAAHTADHLNCCLGKFEIV